MSVATNLAKNLLKAMESPEPLPRSLWPNQAALKLLCEALIDKFDPVEDVAAFAEKFGLTYDGRPRALPPDLADFRIGFLKEEVKEYAKATYQLDYAVQMNGALGPDHPAGDVVGKLAEMLDALQDEIYVAIGTMLMHGFTPAIIAESWRRIHAANMSKVRAPNAEASKRGHASDVVKPEGWVAPSHRDLVENHAHLRVDGGRCRVCGYEGPGPRHECSP